MDTEAWWATVHGVAESWTQLSDYTFFLLCCPKSLQSCLTLCVILWAVALQTPLSMGFSRQEYWSGLPCPPPGDLPYPGIKAKSLTPPALAGGFLTTSATWEARSFFN